MSEPLNYLEIEDIEVFKALNNPTRFRILRQLTEPRSIREVAETMGVPPTRLYYHFNMLEEVGAIRVVETRKVGAMLQKVFQVVARGFRPSPKLIEGDHSPHELAKIGAGVVLDGARVDAEEALTKYFQDLVENGETEMSGSIGRTVAFFTREEAEEFEEKLEEWLGENFGRGDRVEGIEYGFTHVFFPIAGSTPGEET